MFETINNVLVAIDDFVWGVPLIVLILAGGLLLTARLGILQIRLQELTQSGARPIRSRQWRPIHY